MVPSLGLTWTLPNDDGTLRFDFSHNVGDMRPLPPGDVVYTATLTSITDSDADSRTNEAFFTSTLLIPETMNETSLTCTGAATPSVQATIDIILSGR